MYFVLGKRQELLFIINPSVFVLVFVIFIFGASAPLKSAACFLLCCLKNAWTLDGDGEVLLVASPMMLFIDVLCIGKGTGTTIYY